MFCVPLHVGLLCCMKCNNTYMLYDICTELCFLVFIKFLHCIFKTLIFLKSRDRITLLDQCYHCNKNSKALASPWRTSSRTEEGAALPLVTEETHLRSSCFPNVGDLCRPPARQGGVWEASHFLPGYHFLELCCPMWEPLLTCAYLNVN